MEGSVASHPKRATVSHIAANILHGKVLQLCYFWDDGDARFGREGPLPLPNPFSGMCDLSLPADWKPPREPEMAEKREETGITQWWRRVERI